MCENLKIFKSPPVNMQQLLSLSTYNVWTMPYLKNSKKDLVPHGPTLVKGS